MFKCFSGGISALILSASLGFSVFANDLIKNPDFNELKKDGLPQNWDCRNYGTGASFKLERIDDRNVLKIELPELKDKAWLRQPFHPIKQGSLIKLSCRYKTSKEYRTEYPLALFVELSRSKSIDGELSNRLYLKASPEWKLAEKSFISSRSDLSVASLIAVKTSGGIFVDEIKAELCPQSNALNPEKQYIWKEAENTLNSRRATISKWNPEGKIEYSGKGALGCSASDLEWTFNVQEVIDAETLLPRPETYYLWMRVYGYLNRPKVKVELSQKNGRMEKVGAFKTESTEKKDEKGKYAGPGDFYWQYVGPVTVTKGIYKLHARPSERFYCDALLLTNDKHYKPLLFEAREGGGKKTPSFKTLQKKDKVFIDSSYLQFGVTDKFSAPLNLKFSFQKGFKPDRGKENPAYVYAAFPNWVRVEGITSHWAGKDWKTSASADHLKLENLGEKEIEGKKYQLFRVSVYLLYSSLKFFIKASSSEPEKGKKEKALFWVMDGKYESSKSACLLEMVKLGKAAPAFKEIFIGPMGGHMRSFYRDYPGLPDALKYCGINIVNAWGGITMKKSDEVEVMKRFIGACNSSGIAVIDEISPGYKYLKEKPVYALKLDGEKSSRELALHLDKNTPYMQCFLNAISDIVKGGCSGLSLDDEVYNHGNDSIDYSPETVELFKKYLKEKHPDLTFIDPAEFVKSKEKHEKLYQEWIDFRCGRVLLWYKLYRESYDKALEKYKSNSTFGKKYFIPVIVNAAPGTYKQRVLLDIPEIAKLSTHISPMIYTYYGIKDSGIVGKSIKRLKKLTGLKKNIIAPTLLAGHGGYGEIPENQIKMVKYEIYECLINQSPGVFFWEASGFLNPLVLRETMTALKTAVPYENIFLNGKPVKVDIAPSALNIDALKLQNKMLVYASNYNLNANLKARIEIPSYSIAKVTDLEAKSQLTHSESSFSIDFEKEKGRIFLLELKY